MPSDRLSARELDPLVELGLYATAGLGVFAGLAMALTAGNSTAITPWESRSPLTPTLIGLALVCIAPALVLAARATWWEQIRVLVLPTAVITIGLVVVSIVGPFVLRDSHPTFGFSVIWLIGLVPLAGGLLVAIAIQVRCQVVDMPAGPAFPRWTTAPLALLASSYSGLGLGLLGAPRFWGRVVPWPVNDTDARALGVWCLGVGIGLLWSLTENDVVRAVTGARAMLLLGVGQLLAYALHAGEVRWASWPGLSAIGLATGLIFTGAAGQVLYAMADHSREEASDHAVETATD